MILKMIMKKCIKIELIAVFIVCVSIPCNCQREPSLPVNIDSFNQLIRSTISVPEGRAANFKDLYFRFYSGNSTKGTPYPLRRLKKLLQHPDFDLKKPTVVYAHGYVELTTDLSVLTIVSAYLQHGGYNIIVLDWSNLAFGNYVLVAIDVGAIGRETAVAIYRLISGGLPVDSIELVGHSLGAHVLGEASRYLAARGLTIQRQVGLDPAFPGFYPPILGRPMTSRDAAYVVAIHTDGGGYGAPAHVAHADYWPNGGVAKQPGCQSLTLPLTDEDFCSHWRSWQYWAESIRGGVFLARRCTSYDDFLRGKCRGEQLVEMGNNTPPSLRGNFYLRTAAKSPFSLGPAGAE